MHAALSHFHVTFTGGLLIFASRIEQRLLNDPVILPGRIRYAAATNFRYNKQKKTGIAGWVPAPYLASRVKKDR